MLRGKSTKKYSRYLLCIILIGAILRLIAMFIIWDYPERALQNPDSATYISPAVSLLSTGEYPADNGKRTPIYPLFIAFVYSLFGKNIHGLWGMQILIDTTSILLTYVIAAKVVPKPAALIGAFLFAISFENITFALNALSETLFTFLLLLSLTAWTLAHKKQSSIWGIFGSLLLGLTTLCRPIALFYPFVLIGGVLASRNSSWKNKLISFASYTLIFLLTLSPWIYRNYQTLNVASLSTISSYNLLYYNAASLEAEIRGVSESEVSDELKDLVRQRLNERELEDNVANRVRLEGRLARQIILSHPIHYLFTHLKYDLYSLLPDITNFGELFDLTVGGKRTHDVLKNDGLMAAVRHYFGDRVWLLWLYSPLIILLGLIYLLASLGTIVLIRKRHWFTIFILLAPPLYFLMIPGSPSLPRFRLPVFPYLCILAGTGLFHIYQKFKTRSETKL